MTQKNIFFSDGDQVKILEFVVTQSNNIDLNLGLNIQKVKEIVDFPTTDFLPQNYYPYIGILNLRGTPIPLIHLHHFFEDHQTADMINKQGRVLICEFQKLLVGFMIDRTVKIHTLFNKQILPVPEALDVGSKRLFNGVVQKENKSFINLLDVELILDSLQVSLDKSKSVPQDKSYAGMHALVVEDSKLFQKKISKLFENLGINVVMAENGEEGLQKIKQRDFDFIFTDIEMPLLNGIGMAKKIKEMPEYRNKPIIFNTSISNQGLVDDIKKNNLGHYIVKFDSEEIDRILKLTFPKAA
jgi:two-component system chemotaxis response regulator CheV